ncbi:MAG: preprotein translocase subunit SecE [Chlamydiae bacterium]|nr:MAG: preprotein translocase subunit SecE [Chlamydiota bacterium]
MVGGSSPSCPARIQREKMAKEKINIVERSKMFINEVWLELQKVNWTPRRQLIQATRVVIAGTFVLAIYLFLTDTAFSAVLKWFLELRL